MCINIIRDLLGDSGQCADPLQAVTEEGDSTSLAITIGGLSLTFADSDPSSTSLLVRNLLTDSVGIRSFPYADLHLPSPHLDAEVNGLCYF